jgi:catechol 2,3-dioxygenase-like lactoylglutathione lyase family enzyme
MNTSETKSNYNEANVTLMVSDMERSVQFYTASLGLRLKARYGNEFAVLQAPGVTIALHPRTDGSGSAPMSIGLGVDSLEDSMRELQERGVSFVGRVIDDPPVRVIYVSEPDGIPIYLCEQSEWR